MRTRRFELSGSGSINGRSMELDGIDHVVTRGTTEVWEVENISDILQSFIRTTCASGCSSMWAVAAGGGARPSGHSVRAAARDDAPRDALRRLHGSDEP
jgi:hypothetical protein